VQLNSNCTKVPYHLDGGYYMTTVFCPLKGEKKYCTMAIIFCSLKGEKKYPILTCISWVGTKRRTEILEEWLDNLLGVGIPPIKEVMDRAIYLRISRLEPLRRFLNEEETSINTG